MSLIPKVLNTENNNCFHKESIMAKEITFYRQDNNANEFQDSFGDALKYLKEFPLRFLDGLWDDVTEPTELARRIFADPIVSDFLIRTSRLAVFSKELAKSFKGDLESLAIIKQLKFFYNQPTVAVLQQLAILAARSHPSIDADATQNWTSVLQKFTECKLGTTSVRHVLKQIDGPTCYEENAEYLETADPHAVYPTSIYRVCEGFVLAKPDASLIESTMSLTLTTTIKIVSGVLNPESTVLRDIYYPLGRCVAVIDDKVHHLYGTAIQTYFDKNGIEFKALIFPGNEINKDISTVESILVALKEIRVSRNEPVLVVGGGVITDIAGFATALYHRNTPYVMLCTSIVSGIDAGPSPRTCCDGFGYKNLYGAYHPPVLTIVDRSFFRTLHPGWIRHGIAEIVKMAVVKDEELFKLLEKASVALIWTKFGTEMRPEFGIDSDAFGRLCDLTIGKALEGYVKAEYGNLWETHQCRPHAYGHTWSPGYELPSGMLHGHAVATGMGLGAYLSFCEGWISKNELDRILKLLSDLELSLWHPIMEDTHLLWNAQKKMIEKRGGNLAAAVPKGLGKCGYINHMPYELLVKRLKEYQCICQGYPRGGLGVETHCREVGLEDPSEVRSERKDPKGDGSAFDDMDAQQLSYSEWIEEVQKKRTEGLPRHVAFEETEDTPNAPPFEHKELLYPGVEDYAMTMTQVPSADIQNIARVTEEKELFIPCMVGQLEAQFLKMMAQLSNATRVLDVGTFTGMSAMAFAEGLPVSGEVVTIEFDSKTASVADQLFRASSQSHKLTIKLGDAVNVMSELKTAGEKFDIVFLDASKEEYIHYYKLAMEMLTPKGFIMADNSMCALLFHEGDTRRKALHEFNQSVRNDARVEQLILPFREGVSIIRPKASQ